MNLLLPIQKLADWLVLDIFRMAVDSRAAEALSFFIYDTIKIFLLLLVIILVISFLRSFVSPTKVRALLVHRQGWVGNILAALLGVVTPFCSCSAIPMFLGLVEAGVPVGITFSFLIASPMVNEVAVGMLLSIFGIKIAGLYILGGLAIAVVAGLVIGQMNPERLSEMSVLQGNKPADIQIAKPTWSERLASAWQYTADIIKKIWLYILIGVGLGAWVHSYVPASFLDLIAGANHWYGVPLATLLGIPLYANAAGIMPLIQVLVGKGVAMGTALSFMMAVTALSLPELIILRRVLKPRLLGIFVGVVSIGIILIGYLFNYILK
jgi:uncharacterized protein